MKIGKSQRDFSDVKLCHRLFKEPVDAQKRFQVAANQVFHDQKDVVGRLEAIKEVDAKRGSVQSHGIAFGDSLSDHVLLNQLRLFHRFDCVHGVVALIAPTKIKTITI